MGATYFVPDESDEISLTKEKLLAQVDTAMGGHCAEELFIGNDKVTSGCGGDLSSATKYAYRAVESFGMFGEDAGYISQEKHRTSEERRALIDKQVVEILNQSKKRVTALLQKHEK